MFGFSFLPKLPYKSKTESYKEMQIVNGKVVKDVELDTTLKGNKEVIKGHVNNKRVNITRKLRTSTKSKKTKNPRKSKKKITTKK
jgi:hypothetical protein